MRVRHDLEAMLVSLDVLLQTCSSSACIAKLLDQTDALSNNRLFQSTTGYQKHDGRQNRVLRKSIVTHSDRNADHAVHGKIDIDMEYSRQKRATLWKTQAHGCEASYDNCSSSFFQASW